MVRIAEMQKQEVKEEAKRLKRMSAWKARVLGIDIDDVCKCKECGAEFDLIGLHRHLKAHKITVADYYIKHYPRYNKLNGNLLLLQNRDE